MSDSVTAGGSAGYRGYQYQRDVSVWVALNLLLGSGATASEMVVEPASAEDLEVSLDAPAKGSSPALQIAGPDRLTIQVKFRDTGAWSAADFHTLVSDRPKKGTRGPAPRSRAKSQLLVEADRRYVLITSAGVESDLVSIRVRHIADRPPAGSLPPGVADGAQEERALQSRFSIIPGLGFERLELETRQLLETAGHVPSGRVHLAVEALRREVEDRMRGLPKALTRAQVQGIVRGAGGLPHPDLELSEYREPLALFTARAILESAHAVLLVGPPGFGKSLTARYLVYEFRQAQPPFEVVYLTAGVSGIEQALVEPGRHVFFLEDPWGNAGLEVDARTWTVALPKILRRATPDKLFIITSRSDIYRGALDGQPEDPWRRIECPVDDSSYPPELRWEILTGKVADNEGWRDDLIHQHRERLLRDLPSPMALDRFAKALRRCPTPTDAHIGVLINDAQVESVRRVVAEQVKGWPGGVLHACVLWALLRGGRGAIKFSRLQQVQRELERDPSVGEMDLEAFVRHFQPDTFGMGQDGTLSAHSKVVEGLEAVVTPQSSQARRMLDRTAAALNALRSRDATFSTELVALADAVAGVPGTGVELSESVRAVIDGILLERFLAARDGDVGPALRDLVTRASDALPAARLARYLVTSATRPGQESGWGWTPPVLDDAEIAALSGDSASARVAQAWVVHALPDATHYDWETLQQWLVPFGFELDAAFLTACEEMTTEPRYVQNADVVVEGALAGDRPPYDAVFGLLEGWEVRVAEFQAADSDGGSAWQAEVDYARQLHLQERYEEESAIVKHAVDGYVRARRRREGHTWIADHRRHDLILPSWADAVTHAEPGVTLEELDTYFSLIGQNEDLRGRGLRAIGLRKVRDATVHLRSALRTGTDADRDAAVYALHWLDPETSGVGEVLAALQDLEEGDQIGLLLACTKYGFGGGSNEPSLVEAIVAAAPDGRREAFEFALLAQRKTASPAELLAAFRRIDRGGVLRLIDSAPFRVAGTLLRISADEGFDVNGVAEEWLESDDENEVGAAMDALVRIGTPSARTGIARMLEHDHYRVRRHAIHLLAPEASVEEKRLILARADDGSAEVLRALAEIIGERGWEEGVPILLRLLRNRRNYARHPGYGHEAPFQFGVARAAAKSLARFSPLPPAEVEEILTFVEKRDAASRDVEVHGKLFEVLAFVPDPRVAPLLTGMLRDPRVLNFREENLYPARYAAAWALATHIGSVGDADSVDWSEVARGARHRDPQLAAPCLALLGTRLEGNPAPESELLDALRAPETTDPRRAVALLMFDTPGEARHVAERFGVFPLDHPLLAASVNANGNAEWSGWRATPALEIWLRSLELTRDVEGVVLRIAEVRMSLDLGVGQFDVTALRWKQPEVPLASVYEMFGME